MKYKAFSFLLLITVILPLLPMKTAHTKDRFQEEVAVIDIQYGINGYFRVNSVLLVSFKFKNVKKDFDGKVEIRYFSDSGAACSVSKELHLKKNEELLKCFYPYLSSSLPKFLMVIYDDKGQKLWENRSNVDLFDTDTDSEIVIGLLDGAGLSYTFKGESKFNIKKRIVRTEDIPPNYIGLKPFDILIIPNGYLNGPNTREIKVLEERNRTGGLVIEEKNLRKLDLYEIYLLKDDRIDWIWRSEKVIGAILKDLTVKGGRYIVILILYIVLLVPVTYTILYRKRKRVWYYLAVPVISVFFTVVMYVVGSDSRISRLRINYISVMDLRKDRSFESTIFAVTNSTNRSYGVMISGGYRVENAFGLYDPPDSELEITEDLKRRVLEQKHRTNITIGEGAAFETVYFRAEGNPNFHFGSMGVLQRNKHRLTGEFRNKLGIDLENVFAIFDKEVIDLGSVKNGKIKKIDSSKEDVFVADLAEPISESSFMADIFDENKSRNELNKQILMSILMTKLAYRKYEKPVFLAITRDKLRGEFATKIGAESGYSIFLLSGETVTNLSEQDFVNSLNKLEYIIHEEEDSFLYNAFQNRNQITVTYDLPRDDYSKLSFFRHYNNFLNPFTISVKNERTGKFDKIFLPDRVFLTGREEVEENEGEIRRNFEMEDDMSLIGLSNYIRRGKITVKYDLEASFKDSIYSYTAPQMPKLSLE